MHSCSLKKLLFLLPVLLSQALAAQLKLPRLLGDGMVLQRKEPVAIWGWADPGETVRVTFSGQEREVRAENDGSWKAVLDPMPAGGPFELNVAAVGQDTVITRRDMLLGDVWICSGQSNMELTMQRARPRYPKEIATATNDRIRYFDVPDRYDFNAPRSDLQGGHWSPANPQTVLGFSAVAYFFGREIQQSQDVPVGLINAALGGSPVEAWMSEKALKAFPDAYREAQRWRDDALIDSTRQADQQRAGAWSATLKRKDRGYASPTLSWRDPAFDASDWDRMQLPGYWADGPLGPVNGVVWFRRTIELPDAMAGRAAKLLMGRIVDADSVFVNGTYVGNTTYQYPPRRYEVPEGVLSAGENTIAVRVVNSSGRGGFVPDKPYLLAHGPDTVDLAGTWYYRLGAEMPPLAPQTFIRWKPMGLFNGMIAPLLPMHISGVIWYQGESNADTRLEALAYRERFPAMIRDWRRQWAQGDFPFLFVQLANYRESGQTPGPSNWALLRESQAEALALPKTGMAVAIDLGEWNDIHPLNKKDVGYRLALAARKLAYDEELGFSGPTFREMTVQGDTAVLTFDHAEGGLLARNGKPGGFALAGPDGKFRWAEARIEGEQVLVWHRDIDTPVAVRYGWADNPERANLFNAEGLPAGPFRTDKP